MTPLIFECPTCKSEGFQRSIIAGRCTFCDGTESGTPPTPEEAVPRPGGISVRGSKLQIFLNTEVYPNFDHALNEILHAVEAEQGLESRKKVAEVVLAFEHRINFQRAAQKVQLEANKKRKWNPAQQVALRMAVGVFLMARDRMADYAKQLNDQLQARNRA